MKRVYLIMFALLVLTNSGNSAEKRILMEQFTGAWCGGCPGGIYMLDSLMGKYPTQVIGVRQHVGDGMATGQGQDIYVAFGQWGVPTACINRLDFTGKVKTDQNPILVTEEHWFAFAKELLQQTPTSDVSCSWYFDDVNNQIKGYVVSTLLKDLPYQQTLNAIIIENNVTGTGADFDQRNYYSGLKGAEKHPYYNKPPLIVGYQHNLVQRYMVGGSWGDNMNIKKPGYTGESYQWSFCIDVPKVPAGNPIKMNDVDVIGVSMIGENDKSEVLNCAKGVKEIPKTSFLYSTNGYTHFVNDKLTINMKIDNLTEIDNDYTVVIENIGYGARNWLVTVEKSAFAINSGQSSGFNIEVTPKSQGMKKFRVVLKDKDNKTFYAFSDITVYNKDTEKLIVTDPYGSPSSNLDQLDLANYDDFVWLSNDQYYELKDSFPSSKLIVMDNSDYIALSDYAPELFNNITNEGKKLFVIGNGIGANTKNFPKLMTFWASMGFKFNEQYIKFDNLAKETMDISGYNGDPVSDASKFTLVTSDRNKNYSTFGIIDYGKVRPVYSISKDPASIISFRTILNNQRTLFSAFNFFNILDEDQRMDFINRSINWLMNGLGENQPHLSINTNNLNFNLVEISKSDTMDFCIRNYGTSDLVLTSPTIVNESSEFFLDQPLSNQTLNPGDSIIIKIRFTPKTKNQAKGYFFVKANDPYRDSIAVTFIGKGRTSIEDDLSLISSIKTSPNPITQSATITVQFENNIQNVTVNLINLQGGVIKQIGNGDFFAGTHTFNLSTNNLNSGSYFIQITNDASTLCQPVIIDK